MKKIELGCGCNKEEGYIGVDRFQLPSVDIVADLNDTFPFGDNEIDEVWACHSLEHLDNISHTFSEIYRVARHGAIVRILAPYYFTTLNISNFYHKSVWTEDTPRLFDYYPTEMIDEPEWLMPHALSWGVARSDNSDYTEPFQLLEEEFFYFPEYCHLSKDLKRQARRSMINVCDQVYYLLVVNKSSESFSKEELSGYLQIAKAKEPRIIDYLRERDKNCSKDDHKSIYDVLIEEKKSISELMEEINSNKTMVDSFAETIEQKLQQQEKAQEREKQKVESEFEQTKELLYSKLATRMTLFYSKLATRMTLLNSELDDVTNLIKELNQAFEEGVILNDKYTKVKRLYFSQRLDMEKYIEYAIPIGFSELSVCLCSLDKADIFFELVGDGKIINQQVTTIDGFQIININNPLLTDNMYIRIRLNSNEGLPLVKVLLVEDNKKTELAYTVKF